MSYQRSQFQADMLIKMPLVDLVFNKDRCGCHVVPASVEAFKRLRDSNEEQMALVFLMEGEYDKNTFTFAPEYHRFYPLQITRELAYKFLFEIYSENIPENVVDEVLRKTAEARQFVINVITRNQGGNKTAKTVPQPIDPGPTGFANSIPVEEKEEINDNV